MTKAFSDWLFVIGLTTNKSQEGYWKGNWIFKNSSFYIYWEDVPLNKFLWLKDIF